MKNFQKQKKRTNVRQGNENNCVEKSQTIDKIIPSSVGLASANQCIIANGYDTQQQKTTQK